MMQQQTTSGHNVREAVPLFAIDSMEASLRFYVDGLGFEMTNQWVVDGKVRWCRLQLGGAGLMLQQFAKQGHDSLTIEGKRGAGVSICFMCQDALAIYHRAKSRGIETQRPFVGNAMWVVSLSDPDGYRIDFESDTDVPEDTQYSESQA